MVELTRNPWESTAPNGRNLTFKNWPETAANLRLDKKAGTYDNPMIMDLPSTRLRFGNHQVLDRIDGPDLKELYVLLDSLIATTTWSPEPR